MTIRNTSLYPTAVVRELVLFAARAMRVAAWDVGVRVTAAGVAYSGEARGHVGGHHVVSIGIGPAHLFPLWTSYGGVRVGHGCWMEALVATAAHEFQHVRQARDGRPMSESEAERAALGTLAAFDLQGDSARWMFFRRAS